MTAPEIFPIRSWMMTKAQVEMLIKKCINFIKTFWDLINFSDVPQSCIIDGDLNTSPTAPAQPGRTVVGRSVDIAK